MEFFETIKNRRSISKYKSDKVKEESLNKMIEAAMRAPSWKNKSAYKIIVVDDADKKNAIAEGILNMDDKAANAVKEAPVAIVVIAKPEESGKVEGKELYLADGAIAMEHIILAATAEGYGTLWIGALDEWKVKDVLSIPNDFKIIGITPVGIVAEEKEHHKEKDISEYVFRNQFNKSY